MSRCKIDPLRPLTEEERLWLEKISRSQAEPAAHVARARALLAVTQGVSYTDAAQAAGRKSGDTVSRAGCVASIVKGSLPWSRAM
jgi:hypothetical protein